MKRILLATIFVLFAAQPLSAQSCADATHVENRLSEQYGERPVRRGIKDQNSVFEWWENAETGSFTILRRTATGQLCVMTSGKHSFDPTPPPEPEGEGA